MVRILVVVTAVLAACGTSAKPAGAVCSDSSECEAAESCLEFGQFSGSACTVVGKVCSKSCQTTADCADLGSSFMCFASCGSAMVCGAVGP
jgi:hypothetical protein